MKINHLLTGTSALLALGLTACVDDNYDLSDIDTTTRVSINDLVVPANIDDVTLGDIITFDEESRIRAVTIDGKTFYALVESGTLDSDPIHVKNVNADAPDLTPKEKMLDQVGSGSAGSATYKIEDMGNDFSYEAYDIDDAIITLDAANINPLKYNIYFDALNVSANDVDIEYTDLVIQVAKGMTATTTVGRYDAATGLWTIPSHHASGSSSTASLTATAIDFTVNDASITPQRTFVFNSEFTVLSGRMTVTSRSGATLPSQLRFKTSFSLNDIVVNSFDGTLNYHLENLNIDPVNLDDLPDFLSSEGTSIHLANPQIYLNLNNPVADDNLRYESGMSITAVRPNYRDLTFPLDNGTFTVGYDHGTDGPYNLVLSPSDKGLNTPEGYTANLSHHPYTSLSDILAVNDNDGTLGLPEKLDINIIDPQVPLQAVRNFALGVDIPGVKGKYDFIAPLDLTGNSLITYSEVRDGWNDETLDATVITKLSLTTTATNGTPLDAILEATPIDIDGNPIKGAVVKSNKLEANTTTDVVIELTGEIRHLDGVILKATVRPDEDHRVLEPSETIKLANVRARITGYYEKEL